MRGKHLYEYATVRVVPVVEREEFINVGVILFCKQEKFIRMLYRLNEEKIRLLCKDSDCEEIRKELASFEKIANGDASAGTIAQMDLASRFRWLTAVKSAVIQTSRPHPGFSDDLGSTAKRLFDELTG